MSFDDIDDAPPIKRKAADLVNQYSEGHYLCLAWDLSLKFPPSELATIYENARRDLQSEPAAVAIFRTAFRLTQTRVPWSRA
jgi:hypothetical protein